MTASYFSDLWARTKRRSLEEEKAFWDLRAPEFGDVTRGRDRGDKNELVVWLKEKGALTPDAEILDIGCGTGRYALEFAPLVKRVAGLDISPAMVELARKNADESGLANAEFLVLPWQGLTLAEHGFDKRFSLSFASMSPAIDSPASLLAMAEASTRFCFMSGFAARHDSVETMLMERLFPDAQNTEHEAGVYCAFNVLWENGMHAELCYRNGGWQKDLDITVAAKTYAAQLRAHAPDAPSLEDAIRAELLKEGRNGTITQTVHAKIAWLFWEV